MSPFQDPEKRREYQRKWYQKKKAGLETRTRRVGRDHEKRVRWEREYRKKHYGLRSQVFGDVCYICGSDRGVGLHKKDGEPHSADISSIRKALENPDDWVQLCSIPCHKGVHFCMGVFGWEWKTIEENIRRDVVPRWSKEASVRI